MTGYLPWVMLLIYLISGLAFYFRMRKVGKTLGGDYRVRMDVALTLAIAIPFFLGFVAFSSEAMTVFVGMASIVSLAAGLFMIPSVLLDALGEKERAEELFGEIDSQQASFDDQVKAIMDRQKIKRAESSNNSLKLGTSKIGPLTRR